MEKKSNSGHSAPDESTVRQLSSVAKRTLLVESFAKTWTFLCQEIHPIRRKHMHESDVSNLFRLEIRLFCAKVTLSVFNCMSVDIS